MSVSRETVPEPRSPSFGRVRDRRLDGRTRKGDERRRQVMEAVLASCRAGNFRPDLADLSGRTGIPRGSIVNLFGALPLIWRCAARERWTEVLSAAQLDFIAMRRGDGPRVAWLVMVGTAPETP